MFDQSFYAPLTENITARLWLLLSIELNFFQIMQKNFLKELLQKFMES